jgi:hypothetical protein
MKCSDDSLGRKEQSMIPDWILQITLVFFSLVGGSIVFYLISKGSYKPALFWGWLAAVLLVSVVALYIRNDLIAREQKAATPVYSGYLIPANEPGVPLPDNAPSNTVQLLLGDDLRVLAARAENQILSKSGRPFLSIGIKNNVMKIRTTVIDSRNRHLVRIIDNQFQVSHENAFNPLQPDPHSLIVRDAEGSEVLNIRFINERTIRIVGRFHIEGYKEPLVILAEEGICWPGGGGLGHLTMDLTQSEGGLLNFP